MSFQILISLQEDRTGIVIHSKGSWHPNEVILLWCHIFPSLMRKARDLILFQGHTLFDRGIHKAWLLLAKMKWFICDVITDSHLIARRWNMTSNPQELTFLPNEVIPLWCCVFTSLMKKVRDLILLQEGSRTWWRYQSTTAASQHKVINLWWYSRFSSYCRNYRIM